MRLTLESVIDWIEYYGGNYMRLKGQDLLDGDKMYSCKLGKGDNELKITKEKEQKNLIEEANVIWFRGFIRHRDYIEGILNNCPSTNKSACELQHKIHYELKLMTFMFFDNLPAQKQYPNLKSMRVSKPTLLKEADKLGIKIPASIVTNSKKELLDFYHQHNEIIITKPLYEITHFVEEGHVFFFKTAIVTQEYLDKTPLTFFPSLFQECVEKEYELRIFYIDEEFYPMAIFSQLDEQTKVDFRNYNFERPNRTVPYILPKNQEEKLRQLMLNLNINTGSIDLIKGTDGEYYFLEVNPGGQFGMTSIPCNYFLEEKMAQILIKNDTPYETKNIL